MDINEFQNWIAENCFTPTGIFSDSKIKKDPHIYKSLINFTPFLTNPKNSQRCWHIMNNKLYVMKCLYCGDPLKFRGYAKGYGDFCSVTCLSRGTRDKVKKIKKERYGNENYNNSEKNKLTCLERYGVENVFQSEDTKQKIRESKKERYGDEHFVNLEKRTQTNLKKYGTISVAQSPKIKAKINNTNFERYGCLYPLENKKLRDKGFDNYFEKTGYYNPLSNPEIQEKVIQYYQDNFGVSHNMHIPEVAEKCLGWHKNSWHDYVLPSGKTIKLQGFEPKALDMLLEVYDESEILYKRSNMPRLFYIDIDGKSRRYYPDFYIPKDNLLVEVKSTYTYLADLNKNLLKEQCALENGYGYKLMIL